MASLASLRTQLRLVVQELTKKGLSESEIRKTVESELNNLRR